MQTRFGLDLMSSSAFEVPFPEASVGYLAAPELTFAGQMDDGASSVGSNDEEIDAVGVGEVSSRKAVVDKAFNMLVSRVRKERVRVVKPSESGHTDDSPLFAGEGEEDDDLRRSSDDDANTENLDDFSGLDELNLSEDEDEFKREGGPIELKRKKPKQREYAPHGRKQRGYHKWAGRLVALLSTGETGVVLKRPGGRIKVRLDDQPGFTISSSEEKLHVLENTTGMAAINEIYEAARYVPQLRDLRIGQRVAMTRFENATGRIARLPDERRAMNGLGHVLVQLDMGNTAKKAVIESLKLLEDDHSIIPMPNQTNKSLGRPTKAVVANKTPPPHIDPIIPFSKRGDDWRRSLKAPTGAASPPSSPSASASEDDEESRKRRSEDPSRPVILVKRTRHMGDASTPHKPALTRGRKLCQNCNVGIGTASRTCRHCGAVCARPSKKAKGFD